MEPALIPHEMAQRQSICTTVWRVPFCILNRSFPTWNTYLNSFFSKPPDLPTHLLVGLFLDHPGSKSQLSQWVYWPLTKCHGGRLAPLIGEKRIVLKWTKRESSKNDYLNILHRFSAEASCVFYKISNISTTVFTTRIPSTNKDNLHAISGGRENNELRTLTISHNSLLLAGVKDELILTGQAL